MPRALPPFAAVLLAAAPAVAADPPRFAATPAELAEAYRRADAPAPGRVVNERLDPHWIDGGAMLWYAAERPGGKRQFVLVDCAAGTRGPAFDHARLADALAEAGGGRHPPDRLPLADVEFAPKAAAVRFTVGKVRWECDRQTYRLTRVEKPAAPDKPAPAAPPPADAPPGPRAVLRDHNVVLKKPDGSETRLTTDGTPDRRYGHLSRSPDGKAVVALRTTPGERKEVYRVESSPKGGGRAVLHRNPYPLPGDRFDSHRLHLFDLTTGKEIPLAVDPVDFGFPSIRWHRDGRHFTYQKVDRGHQRFRLMRVDAHTGRADAIIDEKADTFVWTAHAEYRGVPLVTWLEKTDELLYCSEKSGWRHLYRLDAATGRQTAAVTAGDWVVRGVDRIDEDARQVWFRACGRNPGEDPYHVHHYRVNFDGTGLTPLTAGDGTHAARFSPDWRFLVDTHSRVDRPPVHELRRTADGGLVCRLEEADVSELVAAGWKPPQVFAAKGRDGVTDIWGVIWPPARLDPGKRYPVVEHIYAGPHAAHVPKTFAAARRFRELTELGFAVAMIDGMGTAFRSKAFHDVCWHDLKDAGFPDRIAWHKAAAAGRPWYDVSRVGIYGTSAGGQNAAGAVLFHGDFYSAAVAACGCHDNRMDKASWNEQWMGYPVGPQYPASSNVEHAHRLRGKLQLLVGELDDNVPPESTYRLADALIRAGKEFEFVPVPGLGHSDGGAYGRRRRQDFFVRHLHGLIPSDRNAAPPPSR